MSVFFTKDTDFFALFREGLAISRKAAAELERMFGAGKVNYACLKTIKDLEHDGDRHVHTCLTLVEDAFITPIDRPDILEVVRGIENITDGITDVSNYADMLQLEQVDDACLRFVKLLVSSCEALEKALESFNISKKKEETEAQIIEVNRLEEEGDALFAEAMRALFRAENPIDAKELVRRKAMYEALERAMDYCEDVADILEKIQAAKS